MLPFLVLWELLESLKVLFMVVAFLELELVSNQFHLLLLLIPLLLRQLLLILCPCTDQRWMIKLGASKPGVALAVTATEAGGDGHDGHYGGVKENKNREDAMPFSWSNYIT